MIEFEHYVIMLNVNNGPVLHREARMFNTILTYLLYHSYLFLFLAIIGPYVHIKLKGITSPRSQVDIFLVYVFVFLVGVSGICAFIWHAFLPEKVALSMGWPPSPQFQFEIGLADLAFGVLGLLSIKWKGDFWKATAIGVSIVLWGAAYRHIEDIILNHNFAPNNAGYVLFYDIFTPLLLFSLLKLRSSKKA